MVLGKWRGAVGHFFGVLSCGRVCLLRKRKALRVAPILASPRVALRKGRPYGWHLNRKALREAPKRQALRVAPKVEVPHAKGLSTKEKQTSKIAVDASGSEAH